MTATSGWRDALTPKPASRRDYIVNMMLVNGVIALLVAALLSALAVSRASHHHVTGVFLGAMVAIGAALSATLVSITAIHTGILDTTGGLVLPDDEGSMAAQATLSVAVAAIAVSALWKRAGIWGGATLVWAGGLGLLLATVVNGRVVAFPVLFIAVTIANVMAGETARSAGLARGVAIARSGRQQAATVAIRARAWKHIAPVLAAIAFLGAFGSVLVLFHDYSSSAAAAHALTSKELLKDLLFTLVINAALMGFFAGRAGRAEASVGYVEYDDLATQRVLEKSAFHRNAIGWAVFAMLLLIDALKAFFPDVPSLVVAALIRACYSAFTAYVAAGLAYVRGAANTLGLDDTADDTALVGATT